MSDKEREKDFKYPSLDPEKFGDKLAQKKVNFIFENWKNLDPRALTGERLGKEIAEYNNLERPGSFQGWLYKHRNHPYRVAAFDLSLPKLAFNEFTKLRVVGGFAIYLTFAVYQFSKSTPIQLNKEAFSAHPFGAVSDLDGGIVHYGYLTEKTQWRMDDFEQA